ncbi:MAG: electron transfer flavoprotein subunit beta/FixA family protein [Bacteroidota bacterium]|nr:electron transfer flavoprotein subunit beta/FixA family protein [Bacteroidota bacterium]
MKIFVCLANVPDTTTKIKFADQKFDETGVQWVINPWDELALTRAMELKEDAGSPVNEVTVVTVGAISSEPTIRKALAIGADNAVRIDAEPKDSYSVAWLLSEYLKSYEGDHLVLTGIESSDYNGFAVGGMLSEFLGVPSVSGVSALDIEGDHAKVSREIDGGLEQVAISTPFVAIVQKGITKEPRIPAMRGIMMARKKPLEVVSPGSFDNVTDMLDFELPKAKPQCKMIDPENAKELIGLLQNEAKVL